jgi:hypothetical protein
MIGKQTIIDLTNQLILPDPQADHIAELLTEYVSARFGKDERQLEVVKHQLSSEIGQFMIDQTELALSAFGKWILRRFVKHV